MRTHAPHLGLYVIAALPALPLGKGALILIFGGMFMLALSLAWSLLLPREMDSTPQHRPWVAVGARATRGLRPWQAVLAEAKLGHNLGRIEVLAAGTGRSLVRLTACRTCHQGTRVDRCNSEARALQRVVRRLDRSARVKETSCRLRGHADCVFEIHGGA